MIFDSPILALWDELSLLGKASQDSYNPGLWLILLEIGLPKVLLPTLMTLVFINLLE